MPETADVSTPSFTYIRLESLREVCRDLMAGLPRSIEKASKYLQREPMEREVRAPVSVTLDAEGNTVSSALGTFDPWKLRVNRARLNNMFQEAVDSLTGKAVAKAPAANEETPDELKEFLKDVDAC